MENNNLSNIGIDETGERKPLDLQEEYNKRERENLRLRDKVFEKNLTIAELEKTIKKQSDLLQKALQDEKTIKVLEEKVYHQSERIKEYKKIIKAINQATDLAMSLGESDESTS
jgi:hypothetical protein